MRGKIKYLVLNNLLDSPILYLSDYIIKHKPDYYRLLGEVKTKDNWEEWILFILKAIEDTSKETTDQIKSINQLFSKLQHKIKEEASKLYNKELLELLFEQPYCKIEFVTDRLKISRLTASKYLNGLEKIGILQSKKVWKEIIYINIELFDLLKK